MALSTLKSYPSKYPTKLDIEHLNDSEWRKQRTLELYDLLPQTSLEERMKYTDIRDEVIHLNYAFFGYVATKTYVNNTSASYEDKFQSALVHFCETWAKYMYAAKYRTDLSFAVFFKPRLSEQIQREFATVKYAWERSIKMEAGEQLGKHWAKVEYEDLQNVKLPPDKMASLQAIFGCMYWADLETHSLFIEAPKLQGVDSISQDLYSDNYDSLVDLLMHEMINRECLIDDKLLSKLSEIHGIEIEELEAYRPQAEAKLYQWLKSNQDMKDGY